MSGKRLMQWVSVGAAFFAMGCTSSTPEDFVAPETGWVASWTELEGTGAEAKTIVVTDGSAVLFDGTGIELRDRDFNFAFWNSPTELYAYSGDVGGRLVTFAEDGASFEVTSGLDDGFCVDLQPTVTLTDDERERVVEC